MGSSGDQLGENDESSIFELKRRLQRLRRQIKQVRSDNRRQTSTIDATEIQAASKQLEALRDQGLHRWQKEEKAVEMSEDAVSSVAESVSSEQAAEKSASSRLKQVDSLLQQS